MIIIQILYRPGSPCWPSGPESIQPKNDSETLKRKKDQQENPLHKSYEVILRRKEDLLQHIDLFIIKRGESISNKQQLIQMPKNTVKLLILNRIKIKIETEIVYKLIASQWYENIIWWVNYTITHWGVQTCSSDLLKRACFVSHFEWLFRETTTNAWGGQAEKMLKVVQVESSSTSCCVVCRSGPGYYWSCVFTEHGPPTDFAFEQLSGHDPVSEGEEITRDRLHEVQQSPGQWQIQGLAGSFNSKWAQSVHVIPNCVGKD